ncbi:hypothetical protein ACKKBF_B39085 [Auxenochlorella protothecoides x Auxenochlorella symbiontica]
MMARAPSGVSVAEVKPNRPPTVFESRLYAVCKSIPEGKVSTYGAMAAVLKSAPRAVGQALRRNPYAPAVPCHRVIAASLELGGFSGQWGPQTPNVCKKRALLEKEGVLFDARGKLVDESQCLGAEELGRACRAAGCEA